MYIILIFLIFHVYLSLDVFYEMGSCGGVHGLV